MTSYLTPKKTERLVNAIENASLSTVKEITKDLKSIPTAFKQQAKHAYSNAVKAGDNITRLATRQKIENALKSKNSITKKLSSFFSLEGGKRRKTMKKRKYTRKH